MIKINTKYFLIALLIMLVSCDDWLTVESKSEIETETLFETSDGFQIAMNGIYTILSSDNLYGQNLKYGFVDVLARMYTLNNSVYEILETYDYTSSASVESMIEQIWTEAYRGIANCNSVLEYVSEKDSTFFPEAGKNMIEGEALSIRALLYFDLLRLFASAPVVADKAEIPYYNELTNEPMDYIATSEILERIIEDLQESKELQRDFDTSDEANRAYALVRSRLGATNGFYEYKRRGHRMGYYATTALLANVALYAGNYELALENAMEFIDNPSLINFTDADEIESDQYNRLLNEDIIFALYNQDFEDDFNTTNMLISNTDDIFGIDTDDFRKGCYLLSSGNEMQLYKYVISEDSDLESHCTFRIPMFRLSQMFHIAIEAVYESNPDKALELFTTLRTYRGCKTTLSTITSKSDLLRYLIYDARREFMGEGQMFFMYKRLNSEILDESRGNVTIDDEFVLPVPNRETMITRSY